MSDETPHPSPEQGPKRSGLKGLAKAESMIQIAMAVPAGVCVGLGIGYLLDRHFNQHWMTVTLMLLGAAGGFVQIFRVGLSGSNTKDDQ